ncbi:MAG: sigma-54-dependent Fis family transcriptional regulator [Calditrichaeota bacterium]|nr:MAG: sigma-54-dependent Fis family transcriptional regulator [Calditrichota bacterium]
MQNGKVLIVDDEPKMCKVLRFALEPEGYTVVTAETAEEAMEKLGANEFDLVVTDLKMPGKDGLYVLHEAKKRSPDTEVVLMTAYATAQTAVEAMKKGAYDYIIKPFEMDELKLKVRHIMDKRKLAAENLQLRRELKDKYSLENMVGHSGVMQQVYKMVERVAPTDATVLIRGESGTGKELVAQAIHQLSPRAAEPFVAVNCGALPESLLESELFGHEKGAFTGADKMKVGRFELAGKGTIFLDEIGDIAPATQIKLLRVLQNRQIERLGGVKTIQIQARTIAATNRDLEEAMREGGFREDLYYRINVFPIYLPPLRERKEDIPELVAHFLTKFGRSADDIDSAALERLLHYDWPGNVRELENIIERSLIMSTSGVIRLEDLPPHIRSASAPARAGSFDIPSEGLSLEQVERDLIKNALAKAGGNKSKAAKLLGITRRKLYSMMERLGA